MHHPKLRLRRPAAPLVFLLAALAIELVDELVDGVTGAAWPVISRDLHLSYLDVGLLMGVPYVLGSLADPVLGLLADAGHRRRFVLLGGATFAVALLLTALSTGFWPLLLAFTLFFPASGAFVSLTQAALMDADPARRELNMARWSLAGSAGNAAGPLLVSAAVAFGLGWRPVFALLAVLAVAACWLAWRHPALLQTPAPATSAAPLRAALRSGLQGARTELRRGDVRVNLVLLECANLLLDVFRGFVALYFVDAVRATPTEAGVAVAVLTLVGLAGDALVLPVLQRVAGVTYVRCTALATTVLFPAFLLAPGQGTKLLLLGALGLLTAGWYAVLQARLYDLIPDRSGTVLAIGTVTGMLGGLIPALVGLAAQHFGMQAALWLLLAGPLALLAGLPRRAG